MGRGRALLVKLLLPFLEYVHGSSSSFLQIQNHASIARQVHQIGRVSESSPPVADCFVLATAAGGMRKKWLPSVNRLRKKGYSVKIVWEKGL